MKTIYKNSLFLLLILGLIISSCTNHDDSFEPDTDSGDYLVTVKYDSIKTYPSGGGIFVIKFTKDTAFTGTIKLKLENESRLNAILSKTEIKSTDTVVDITLSPSETIETGSNKIKLIANHNGTEKTMEFNVDIMDWGENINDAKLKLEQFNTWITQNYPQYEQIFTNQLNWYSTYPQVLIVEHYTILTNDFEARLCYHVMIPPYDWSKLWIRNRNKMEAEFAVERLTDGVIKIIPMSEYPVIYGY